MQDGFSILSPAGYIMDVGVIAPQNGPGTYGGVVVSKALSCGSVQARGRGEYPISGRLSGRQGTMQINCTTGAPGTAQAVAFIAVSPSIMLGVAVDTTNRPYALIIDNLGFSVGRSGTFGPALPAGVPLTIQFAWDVENIVYADDRAGFQFNDQVAVWYPDVATWAPFVPTTLYVGTSLGGLALSNFTGVVGKVQVGDKVVFEIAPGAIIEEEEYLSGNAVMPGLSTVSGTMDLILGGFATINGDSGETADGTVLYAAGDTMAGDSGETADGTVLYAAGDTMAGDSSVSATATVVP